MTFLTITMTIVFLIILFLLKNEFEMKKKSCEPVDMLLPRHLLQVFPNVWRFSPAVYRTSVLRVCCPGLTMILCHSKTMAPLNKHFGIEPFALLSRWPKKGQELTLDQGKKVVLVYRKTKQLRDWAFLELPCTLD